MICPWLSSLYMAVATPICLWLLRQLMALAFSLALLKAGKSIAARMAMMAITTNSSIRVKPAGPVARRMGVAFLYSVLIIATHILLGLGHLPLPTGPEASVEFPLQTVPPLRCHHMSADAAVVLTCLYHIN